MGSYLVGRVLQAIAVVFAVSVLVFLAVTASGDAAALLAPIDADPADVEALRHQMGLDRPLHVQYLRFVAELTSGDLISFRYRLPPTELIAPHLLRSLQLGVPALGLAVILGIPLGLLSAIRRGSAIDTAVLLCALVGQTVPLFLLAVLLIWTFCVRLHWLPVSGRGTFQHFVLPVACICAYNLAVIVRLTRSSCLEVLGQDYITTARAKGLSERMVMWRHAFPNAALPVVSLIGLRIGAMLSGMLVVESIFAWPGMGKLLYDAILQRDMPLVVVGALWVAILVAILNFLVDLLYSLLDPRIQY